MRRKIRRSLRTSSPVHRRSFRPVVGWLEARTLLSGNPTYYTVNLTSDTGASSGTDAATGDPSGDLLWAVEQANANSNPCGSVINFDPSVFATAQTITLSSTLELSESAGPEVIDATGLAGVVTISGNNAVGVFQVDDGVAATLSGLTISGGSASDGGGILTQDYATLTLSNSTLSGNSATYGAALENNYLATVINSVFLNNTAGAQGGAIYNDGIMSVSGSTFTGNSANGNGSGGAIFDYYAPATLSNDAFSNNTAYQGGALFNYGGGSSLSLSGSTLSDNTATGGWGGGIWSQGTLTIATSTIAGNTAPDGSGGGIWNQGTLALTDATLADNSALGAGGLVNAGGAVIEDSTLSGNSTPNSGGAIWTYGTMTIVNSTIADNQAGGVGGAIFYSAGSLTVVDSTIAYNITGSGRGGGGIWSESGNTATLDNTIVAENDLNGNGDDLNWQGGGGFTGSNNLVVYDATGTLNGNDNLLGVADPGIGLLANNGGPTQTIALLAGSPAIDAGSNALAVDPTTGDPLTTDQRGAGFPRIEGASVDVGAFERPTTIGSPTVYTVTDTSNSTSDTGSLPYAVAQADANVNLAGTIIQFDPSVFNSSNPQTITLTGTLELSEPSGPITIAGPGSDAVTINGNSSGSVFQVITSEVAGLSGLTISGGLASDGGGILTQDYATLTLSNSTLSGNSATYGAALENNYLATVINSVFLNNTAGAQGGAIYNDGILSVSGSTFTGNSANGNGSGGAIFDYYAPATLSNDAFSNNTAYQGGALFNYGGGSSLSLSGSTLSDNTATGGWGGGIWSQGTLTIATSTIAGNTAPDGSGGGIWNQGTLALTDATLADNSALGAGGLVNAGGAVIEDSTLSGNSTPNSGGGIWTYGTMTIVNSTIADNQASLSGGGVFYTDGSLTAVNSTIAYNTSSPDGGGGIFALGGAPVTLDNTVVAENNLNGDGDDLASDDAGGFTGSNNLVGYDASGTLSSNDNLLGVGNAGIGLLANNGGPTQTIALLAGSPAIDAGSNALAVDPTTGQPLAYDQRGVGFPRIEGGTVDIGAFERPTTIGSPTVYTVTDNSDTVSDTGSLPYAIAQANTNPNLAGSIIQFDPAVFNSSTPQTITLTGALELSEPSGPITLSGPGADALTINANNTGGVFQVDTSEVAALSGMTITGADFGSAIATQDLATLTLSNSTLADNVAYVGAALYNGYQTTVINSFFQDNGTRQGGPGGAIYNNGVLDISGSTFSGNGAYSGDGGAIFNDGAATLTNDVFSYNSASYGGALFNQQGTLSLSGCTISGNTSSSDGGGIANAGKLSLVNCTVSGNTASGNGGGLSNVGTATVTGSTFAADSAGGNGGGIANYGTLVLSGSSVTGDVADGDGGGISNAGTFTVTGTSFTDDQTTRTNCCNGDGGAFFNQGYGTITNSAFTGNAANGAYGGGLMNNGGSLTISGSTFRGNTAYDGAGLFNGAAMTLSTSTLMGNSSSYDGGGISNQGSMTVSACTLSGNYGGVFGGGIGQSGPMLDLIDSTLAENSASDGGGIYDSAPGLTVINSTIAYNGDNGSGPGIYDAGGSPTLDNTIVAWNTVGGGLAPPELDTGGTPFTSASAYNLIGVDTTGSFSGNCNLVGVTNPGLGILANNGGPTQTIALLAGSPAIDAGSVALAVDQNGNPLTTDQRGNGYPRVVNGTVDIGAFQGPTAIGSPTVYTVNLTSANGTGSGNSGDLAYVIGQADANVNPAGSIVQFDPTVFATPQTITLSNTLQLAEPSGPLLINGPGASLVTISGNNAVGVFQADSGEVATLSGLTISAGSTSYYGGGILALEFSTLTVSQSTISGNTSSSDGGGIANAGKLSLVNCTVSGNTASGNGGGLSNVGTATVTGSTFAADSAGGNGGGIANYGTLVLSGSSVTGDVADGDGGGISNAGTFTVTGTSFTDDQTTRTNCCNGDGGAFFNQGYGTITNSAFTGNAANGAYGGGLMNNGGSLTISGSTFRGNTAYDGAGLFNGAAMTLSTSTLMGNSSSYDGGGISNQGSMTVSACTLSGNYGGVFGGGIGQSGPMLDLIDSTLAENSASDGGGIYDSAPGLTVINSTIAYNGDNGSGPGIYDAGGSPTLDNTIVAWNTVGGGLAPPELDTGGTPFSSTSAYNLISVDTTGSFSGNGNLLGVTNVGLGILANNGGPTQTIALLAGSPAIDAGSVALAVDPTTGQSLTYDQRGIGYPRIVAGTVDIGAYEGPDPTTTTAATSVTPSVYGQPVTFTATVAATPPLSGTAISPTGTVTFYDGTTALGTSSLNATGVAKYETTAFQLSVGSNQWITAVYGGDANYNTSTSSVLTQTVSKDSTTTTSVASSANPSVSGQMVTFTATVAANAPGSGTPTGTVTFYANGLSIGTGALCLVNGQDEATFTTSTLSTASHSITAAYTSGDGNFNASPVSAAITQVVNKASTSATVVSSLSPSVSGQAVMFTATVGVVGPGSTAVASPSGTVTFYNNGTAIGTAPLSVVNGQDVASLSIATLSTASHSITAAYTGGDTNFSPSTPSAPITQAVNKASTGTAVATSVSPSVYGQSVMFTATISVVSPGSTAVAYPTGTVTFYDGGTSIGTGTLSVVSGQDQATFTTSALSTATHSITAAYTGGDGNFNGSAASAAITQIVNKDSTTTAVSASPTFANVAQTVTFTARVTANAPGSGTPSGTVDFFDTTTNTDLTPLGVSLSSGTATFSTTSLAVGSHTIKATYSGDTNFLTSNASTGTITIGQSIILLDPTAGGALSLSGNAGIQLSGGVYVDSSSSTALSASGNATIKASVIDVTGKVSKSGNASFSPAPVTGAAVVADPLASLAEPSTSGLTNYGSESLSGNSSATINPGIYSAITVSGNAKLTMNCGIYIIEGGGFSISGNASVTGSGVMIFNAGTKYPTTGGTYGSITLSGNGSYNLSPLTSGTYAGIVIFQSRDNTKALTISGNASGMTGLVYAPAAQIAESGNAQLNAAIIADTMTLSGNGISNAVTLSSPAGSVAYTPSQIRAAYGISALALDGTGQTIAIVDAYDDPDIFQAVDAFDTQFGLAPSGPSLYDQYGPASSFLTVLNQNGQATSLPSTDPNGPGTDNWELEESLDVEWAHAIAPGAQIILVEASSQALSDLMASVATAAHQPGVSVVSMSWGFPEGQAVFAADEAAYDSVFNVPGVTFVASTGDYGAADPEYPAYSPNVVAVGGTSLTLNADGSYNSETGWGYYSSSAGALIGSGGGISLYEPEPAYQQGVQATGYRTTPDVSLVADPATGAWIADPYNLDPGNPFQVVGGTSLSAPAWAGLLAVVDQGRSAAGEPDLNSASSTDTQQALYMLPQSDYKAITSGNNGYSAAAGYNLVTGLGTPVANLMVPDLIAYQGAGTTYSGSTVPPLQNSGLVNTGASDSGPMDVFSVFDSFTVTSVGLSHVGAIGARGQESTPGHGTSAVRRVERLLTNPPEDSPIASRLAVGDGLAQPLTRPATASSSVIDQVLGALPDTDSRDTLIGDLAFEQVSSGTRKPRGSAAI